MQGETWSLSQTYDISIILALGDRLSTQYLVRISEVKAETATGLSLRPVTINQGQVKKLCSKTILEIQTKIQEERAHVFSTCNLQNSSDQDCMHSVIEMGLGAHREMQRWLPGEVG